jgi:hypothetical protein
MQCHTNDQIANVVKDILDCVQHLLPLMDSGNATLVFDPLVEQRMLKNNESFLQSIGNIENDLRRDWYIYTRNRAEIASANKIALATLACAAGTKTFPNTLAIEFVENSPIWLSFGNHDWTIAHQYQVSGTLPTVQINNAYHKDSLKALLPIYKASPKHKKLPYTDSHGNIVSPMTFNDAEAEALLLISTLIGNDRWTYHTSTKKYVRFVKTHNNTDVYHGFEVEEDEIPQNILAQIN